MTSITFEFDSHAQKTLVPGLDYVARTMRRGDEIGAFEATHPPRFDLQTLTV